MCGQDANGWLDRKDGRRKRLKRIQKTYLTREGKRDLLAPIDYATAAVKANMGTSEFWVGALPIAQEPKPPSAALLDRSALHYYSGVHILAK